MAEAPRNMEELLKEKCFRECQARAIVAYYLRTGKNIHVVTGHFEDEGVPRRRILEIVRKYLKTGSVEPRQSTGRPLSATTTENIDAVRKLYQEEPTISIRQAARRLNINPAAVARILTDKLNIKAINQGKNKFLHVPNDGSPPKKKTSQPKAAKPRQEPNGQPPKNNGRTLTQLMPRAQNANKSSEDVLTTNIAQQNFPIAPEQCLSYAINQAEIVSPVYFTS